MRNLAKHIFCFSVLILVLAIAACKKDSTTSGTASTATADSIARADSLARLAIRSRDSVVGSYAGVTHYVFTVGDPINDNTADSIVSYDTLVVSAYSASGVVVANFNDQFTTYTNRDDLQIQYGSMAANPQGILNLYYNGSVNYHYADHSSISVANFYYFAGHKFR